MMCKLLSVLYGRKRGKLGQRRGNFGGFRLCRFFSCSVCLSFCRSNRRMSSILCQRTAIGLEVALLALDQPQEKILFNITHSRGIFHLVFDVLIISVLSRQLIKSLEREKSKQGIEVSCSRLFRAEIVRG